MSGGRRMSEKQILAALEITDHEVRLLVAEFFNSRLNVIRTERTENKGMDGLAIKNSKEVVSAIRKVVDQASAQVGTRIERVLLCIPAYRTKKDGIRLSKAIDNYERKVTSDDVQTLVRKGYSHMTASDMVTVNWMCKQYITNGIVSRRVPLNDVCDILDIDMDLLFADKMTTYDYASVVESAGLDIIDICLDNYAVCKEATLFEQSLHKNVISMHIEKDRTTLSAIVNGSIEETKIIYRGYGEWEKALMDNYDLNEAIAHKLLLQNMDATKTPKDTPVYMWTKNDIMCMIKETELHDTVLKKVQQWIESIRGVCEPILQFGSTRIVLSGEGAELDGLDVLVAETFKVDAKTYYPDTIGARNCCWTVCLGMIYAYVDHLPLIRSHAISVNETSYFEAIKKKKREEEPDDSLTTKLKGLLFQDQKK